MRGIKNAPHCDRRECFGNYDGYCQILTGMTDRQPCPFFKTRKEYRDDRETAAKINEIKADEAKAELLDMLATSAAVPMDAQRHTKNRK